MGKLDGPKPALRASTDASDEEGGAGADGRTEGERWAGWSVLRPQEGNPGAVGVGRALRDHYEGVVEEPIPDILKDLLTRLG